MMSLFYNLITKPSLVFTKSAWELRNPAILSLFLITLVGTLDTGFDFIVLILAFLLIGLLTIVNCAFFHLTARFMSLSGHFLRLFYATLLAMFPMVLSVNSLILGSGFLIISGFIEVLIYIWVTYLMLKFIQATYQTSIFRSVVILIAPLIMTSILVILLAVVFGASLAALLPPGSF